MGKRKAIGKRVRFEVFKRDEFTCQYCGSTPPSVVLEVDHIHAVAQGGGNDEDNLVTSCFNCNRGKGAELLTSVPESLSNKAVRIKESELQLAEFHKVMQGKKDRIESESWDIAEILSPGCSETGFSISDKYSICTFLERLPYFEVEEAMEIATSRHSAPSSAFRYFCGICWRKIKDNAA